VPYHSLAFRLSLAGFAATLVTYGPARIGFGLFLPDLKASFAMSDRIAGLVSAAGFAGFFIALLCAQALTTRYGARGPVLGGLALVIAGFAIAAAASNLAMLSVGIVLALSSAGLTWSPFNNVIQNRVQAQRKAGSLSVVSTGTALGIVIAGIAALFVSGGGEWRWAWAGFALLGIAALVVNAATLVSVQSSPAPSLWERRRGLRHRDAWPLYGVAFSFGITSAVFITFAPDFVERSGVDGAGSPTGNSAALIFIVFGLFGLFGLLTASFDRLMGMRPLLSLLMAFSAVSCALTALAPSSMPAILAAGGLQGGFVMTLSAVMSYWSNRLFGDAATAGFTVALLAAALGNVLGPSIAGFAERTIGMDGVFLVCAALSAATGAILLFARTE